MKKIFKVALYTFFFFLFILFSRSILFSMQERLANMTSDEAKKRIECIKEYGPLIDQYSGKEFTGKFEQYEQMADEYAKKGEQEEAFWANMFESEGEREKKIQEFNNTLLLRFPQTGPLSVGIYKGDIVRGVFLGADLCVDWYFYKKLTDYCVENLFKKITKNTDGVIRILVKTGVNLNSKDKKLKKISEDGLIAFMQHNFSLDYLSLIKNSFVRHLIFYLFLTEVSRVLKDQFLGQRDIKSLSILWHRLGKPLENSGLWNYFWGKPIPISHIIESWFIASRPLTSGMGYFSYLFNTALTEVEIRPKFLDSYWLLFVKEVFILLVSMKSIYRDVYQKSFFAHLKAFYDEFVPLLKLYKSEKEKFKGTAKNDKNKFFEIEKKVKEFIGKAYDFSFTFWLKQKNYVFARNEFWVNVLFNGIGIGGKVLMEAASSYLGIANNQEQKI